MRLHAQHGGRHGLSAERPRQEQGRERLAQAAPEGAGYPAGRKRCIRKGFCVYEERI
jgi:hypothetical protein